MITVRIFRAFVSDSLYDKQLFSFRPGIFKITFAETASIDLNFWICHSASCNFLNVENCGIVPPQKRPNQEGE
jgi:hypothetical protein